MKRKTVEIVVETLEDKEGGPEQRFLIQSGFGHLMIQVTESPFDLEVKYAAKVGTFNVGKPDSTELLELDELVNTFAERMKRELHVQFYKGREGWKNEALREHYVKRLIVHAAEGRMIKAACYAATIWWVARMKRGGTAHGS